jgi:hypothetical protein
VLSGSSGSCCSLSWLEGPAVTLSCASSSGACGEWRSWLDGVTPENHYHGALAVIAASATGMARQHDQVENNMRTRAAAMSI